MGHNGDDAARVISLLKELGERPKEESLGMMPILLSSLKSDDPCVVTQSIVSGTSLFCAVLEEMALQLHNSGQIGRWLEEIWAWMVKFKDAVSGILFEPCSFRAKMLAVKFLEICVLLFTSDVSGGEVPSVEGKDGSFNISQLVRGHSVLTASGLANESNKALGLLMEILQPNNALHGSLKIVIINCLAAIAKNRPVHYSFILSALLNLDLSGGSMGGHPASIRYALRTAFLGFLRCTNPSIIESRDRLLRALQAMNPGETAEQVMRHVEKMSKNLERSRDIGPCKDNSLSRQAFVFGDSIKKRHMVQDDDINASPDGRPAKRTGFIVPVIPNQSFQMTSGIIQDDNAAADEGDDDGNAFGGFSVKASVMDSDLAPLNEMINMIVALRAERERGNRSLDILVSRIEADLLADLVIECMKNLPIKGFPLYRNQGNVPINSQASSSILSAQAEAGVPESVSVEYSTLSSSRELTTATVTSPTNLASDLPSLPNISYDVKRDPRRDPRRLDPRRTVVPPSGLHSLPLNSEENNELQSGLDHSLIKTKTVLEVNKVENPVSLISKSEPEIPETPFKFKLDVWNPKETSIVNNYAVETEQTLEHQASSNLEDSATQAIDEELVVSTPPDVTVSEDLPSSMVEADQCLSLSTTVISEDICHSRRILPPFIELIDERRRAISKLAIMRIIGDQQSQSTSCSQARLQILARLVSLVTDGDDILTVLQQKMRSDYYRHKGHELAIKILYQLFTIIHSEFDEHATSVASSIYDDFLLSLARSLLDSLPSSDKSFCRLLAEAPYLPHSVIMLLEDLCHSHGYDQNGKDAFDGDRVTQGLGAVWSLILGRPPYRQACLDIALKCAVDSQDEVRAKAVRLVANKLYPLDYASEHIEHFAKSMLLSVVDRRGSEAELKQENSNEERTETGNLETSFSPCEAGVSGMDSTKGIQALKAAPISTSAHAQHQTPLFFALCSKKPSLLQLVFDLYGRSPKAVKQSVHRHLPALVRTLGPSYSEILHIVSNPPEGSEDLIMLVLDILTENVTPAADLVAAVKHLYETKLKDAAILIPMLSSFSKDEVLPIFPQLVGLPLEKFQMALARILQGSAHTGPALTPVEVLVAIHGIVPEKDGIALRKITDACTACFEQRTVFTQQVLAKSLNLMVEQVPLPLLFMRTIIQAIDAFPNLVDFVMGILSKLVSRQVWKMPKLWPGFMKCLSQTPPHSYNVLLQLPTPQLEICLNRYGSIRGHLATYVNQQNIGASLPSTESPRPCQRH